MLNQKLAGIFYELAEFLAMEDIAFKPQAYERTALNLEILNQDVKTIFLQGGERAIEEIPGVGKSIAEKIIEYIKTGRIKFYEQYKKKYPFDLRGLTQIEGIGPKTAKELYEKLKIKNFDDLEKATKAGKIRDLPGFGERTEQNILQGIAFVKKSKGRFLLAEILPLVRFLENKLKESKEIKKVSSAGSLRRLKETIGDIDFLAVSENPKKTMDFFCSMKGIVKVLAKGKTRSSIRLDIQAIQQLSLRGAKRRSNLSLNQSDNIVTDVDLRLVPAKSYGAALQYFTGSKEHNIKLRKIALAKGYKLNEYGLFKGSKMLASETEEKIYEMLGLSLPVPEIREDRGEIELALENRLPDLVKHKDIRGDLHCHSNWDGGNNSILEMAQTAMDLGYEYLGISDHTEFLKIEQGLTENQLLEQRKEIGKANYRLQTTNCKLQILQGCEANILDDGSLDVKDETLKKLDYVIAGVHSNMKMPKKQMTDRIIRAMKNPCVKIISHPTGRILKKRDEYQIDFGRVLRAAKETKTILEINSSPYRLDLNDLNIKKALGQAVKLIINSDAHQKEQLRLIEYGVFQARRGWAEKKDIVNTLTADELMQSLK